MHAFRLNGNLDCEQQFLGADDLINARLNETVKELDFPERATLPMRRWRIAWLLGLGVLVNYFDRVNISVSQASLFTAFGISSITFGYLSGAYNWTYALCQLPVGVLLDKFGVKKIGRISTFIWSLASFGAAIAPGVPSSVCGAADARSRRGAHFSLQRKGNWSVVSSKAAQLSDVSF